MIFSNVKKAFFLFLFIFLSCIITGCFTFPNEYTVTFKDHNGDILKVEHVNSGHNATAPNDPIRIGYRFLGWDSDFSNVTSDLFINAQYEQITFLVTFKDLDGTVLKTETVNHGADATAPIVPVHEGFVFARWNLEFTNVLSDLVIIALYDKTYLVSFKDYDGTVLKTEIVLSGSSATAPNNPERTGYTFTRWDQEFNSITSDLEIIAQYTINQYTIIFKDYDDTILKTETVTYKASATAPDDPERNGYTFTRWDQEFNSITSDLEIIAQYTINQYTIIFKDYDGTILKSELVEYLSYATAPNNPERTGYSFTGWDQDISMITSCLVVNATYEILKYTVTFNTNGGVPIDSLFVEYHKTLTLPIPIKEGYLFMRWELNGEQFTESDVIIEDITLDAVWDKVIEGLSYLVEDNGIIITGYTGSEIDLVIPELIIGLPVIEIAKNAFIYGQIYSISIPSTVKRIGFSAFYECSYLDSIIFNELSQLETIDEYAFYGCENLFMIELPNGLMAINDYAFYNCFMLRSINIPLSVMEMGKEIFVNCLSLTVCCEATSKPTGWDSTWNLGVVTYWGCLGLKENETLAYLVYFDYITIIGLSFTCYQNNIFIPETLEGKEVLEIKEYAFSNNPLIKNIIISDTITEIKKGTFNNCFNLETVTFSDSSHLQKIEEEAFYYCKKLTSINLPMGLISINHKAFSGCSNLESIIIPDSVISLGEYAFEACTTLTNVVLSNNLTSIQKYTFFNCNNLVFVNIPSSANSIGEYAFTKCHSLTSVVIPEGVTCVESYAFNDCESITSIIISSSVLDMGVGAIYKCLNATIYCKLITKPVGWNYNWNLSNCLVVWNYKDFYTVSFIDYNDNVLKTEQVAYNTSATPPSDPIRIGYKFTGWDIAFSNVVSDLTIRATYERLMFTVTFNTNGCDPVESVQVYYNETITLPVLVREGFEFKGWLLEGVIFTSSDPVTKDITLDALWDEIIEGD